MKILFISHDYTKTGAPTALLRLIKSIKKLSDIELYIDFIYERGDEKQLQSFLKICERVKVVKQAKLFILKKIKFDLIFTNTIVTGEVIEELASLRKPIFTWIHEMPHTIEQYGTHLFEKILMYSSKIFFVDTKSLQYGESFIKNKGLMSNNFELLRGCVDYQNNELITNHNSNNIKNISNLAELKIVSIGNAIWRKGIYDVPHILNQTTDLPVHLYWFGAEKHHKGIQEVTYTLELMNLLSRFTVLGFTNDIPQVLTKYDVFLAISHEEPGPLTILEAASVGLPTICWNKSIGLADFVQNDAGWVVEYQNFDALRAVFEEIIANPEILKQKGEVALQRVLTEYTSEVRAKQFLKLIGYTK